MEAKSVDPAFLVCKFIQDYGEIWDRHFPNCVRKAHWQIALFIRMHEDGVLFSRVRGRLDSVYGMEEETSILRIEELVAEGLILQDETPIRSSTCLSPSETFVTRFDAHTVEAAQALYSAAVALDQRPGEMPDFVPGSRLNKVFLGFFERFLDSWNDHRTKFLKERISHSPARRDKALQALKTFAYWHILMASWLHQHPQSRPKRNYLLVDDFHGAIYQHLGVSVRATTSYVQNMIEWGFLRRLNKDDGVPKGKFAVRMEAEVFESFRDAFAAVSRLVTDAGGELAEGWAQKLPAAEKSAKVLKFQVSR